jgi:hypothetical protein
MPSRGSLMCHFSGILGSTLAENSSIRFAIVENLYESLFLTLNRGNWRIDFSQNRAPWSGHIFCKVRHKNSIDPNSCSSRQDESNHQNSMGFRNYCWSGGMPRRSWHHFPQGDLVLWGERAYTQFEEISLFWTHLWSTIAQKISRDILTLIFVFLVN